MDIKKPHAISYPEPREYPYPCSPFMASARGAPEGTAEGCREPELQQLTSLHAPQAEQGSSARGMAPAHATLTLPTGV